MCRGRYGRVGQELTQWGKQNKNKTNSYSAEQFHITVILCLKITQHKLNSRRSICFHIVWKNHSPFKWLRPSWTTLYIGIIMLVFRTHIDGSHLIDKLQWGCGGKKTPWIWLEWKTHFSTWHASFLAWSSSHCSCPTGFDPLGASIGKLLDPPRDYLSKQIIW